MLRTRIPYITKPRHISKSLQNGDESILSKLTKLFEKDDTSAASPSKLPLSTPLPVTSTSHVSPVKSNPPLGRNSRMTVLPSGLKVCTENSYGDFVTIGAAVESGCRFENGYPFGVSRIVEKLAFNSSVNFPQREDIYASLMENSGIVDCQSTRDTTMYAASCHRNGTDPTLKVLADTILRPVINEEDVEFAEQSIGYENVDMKNRIETLEIVLADYIHQAAFQHNTIGYPKYGNAEKVRVSDVYGYLSKAHVPERMVVGGTGVDHDEFVSLVSRYFDWSESIWKSTLSPQFEGKEIDTSRAQYTGGEVRVEVDLKPLTIGKPYPLLAHVVVGLEGCGYKDADFVPLCVLQSLLGGGGAFSAGGPGKGMYARMYTDVMNQNHWLYSAIAHNHSYADAGVFTLTASAPPQNINDTLILLVHQLLKLQHGVGAEELARARTQLRSHLMMNLEVRPVLFEDMVRQVLGHGERRQPEEYAERIEKVTNADILRVTDRLLASKPSLVGYGDISKLSDYTSLDQAVAKRDLSTLFKN